MDWEPAEFRKLRIRQFPPHSLRETAEGKFWKRFGAPVVSQQARPHAMAPSTCAVRGLEPPERCQVGKPDDDRASISHARPPTPKQCVDGRWDVHAQIGAVSHIEFRPQYPYNYAVTSSTRIVVFDAATRQPRRTFSRFKDKAYSGSYRSDGRLLVAGGESGIVQVACAGSSAASSPALKAICLLILVVWARSLTQQAARCYGS